MFNFIKQYQTTLIVILVLIALSTAFGAGIKVHSYYVGYQQNIDRTIKDSVDKGMREIQRNNADNLADTQRKLDGLKGNTTIEKIPTIVDRPIYLQYCGDEDGAKVLRDYKEQSNRVRLEGRKFK